MDTAHMTNTMATMATMTRPTQFQKKRKLIDIVDTPERALKKRPTIHAFATPVAATLTTINAYNKVDSKQRRMLGVFRSSTRPACQNSPSALTAPSQLAGIRIREFRLWCAFIGKFINSTHANRSCDYVVVDPAKVVSTRHCTVHALVSVSVQLCPFVQMLIALPSVRSDAGKISIVCQVRIIFWRPEASSSSNHIRISAKMECFSTGRRSCAPRSFSWTATNSEFLNPKVGLYSPSFLGPPS